MKKEKNKIPILVFSTFFFCILFNFPILNLVNKPYFFLGFPILYIFIFIVWLILILISYLIVNRK